MDGLSNYKMETTYNKKLGSSSKQPKIQITCLSNVFVRKMDFAEKGIIELGHRHPFDHASLVSSGAVEIQVYDDETKQLLPPVLYKAPSLVYIQKGVAHQITSVEDNTTVCCIHALRDEDETIIDPSMIPIPQNIMETTDLLYKRTGKFLSKADDYDEDLVYKRRPRYFNAADKF